MRLKQYLKVILLIAPILLTLIFLSACRVTSTINPTIISTPMPIDTPAPTISGFTIEYDWAWQNPLPQGNSLASIWGSSARDIYAVGYPGLIMHYGGNGWKILENGPFDRLYEIWGTSSSDIYVVGCVTNKSQITSYIVHYDGKNWKTVVSDIKGTINDFWGSSASDIFAVGDTIWHYDGIEWKEMETGNKMLNLKGVWGTSPSDVFAVGPNNTRLLHYDGESWSSLPVAHLSMVNDKINDVWGTASNNVYAIGDSILHYDGNIWKSAGPNWGLTEIWGTSPDNIFAVGYGCIVHYDGIKWTEIQASGLDDSPYYLTDVWGISSSDVYFICGNTILHYNGNSWSNMMQGTTRNIHSIWGTSSEDVYAVGGYDQAIAAVDYLENYLESGILLHYNGTSWETIDNRITGNLAAVWAAPSGEVFAAGGYPIPTEVEKAPEERGVIVRYAKNSGISVNIETNSILYAVWGDSASDVFAGGADGTLLHYDGNEWSPMDSNASLTITGIWGNSPNDIFAVGDKGGILHYDGRTWSPVDSGTKEDLRGIWGSSATDVVIVGDNNTILRYDGSAWRKMSSDNPDLRYIDFFAVWGSSSSNIYAVQSSGILHYNGQEWKDTRSPVLGGLFGIWGSSAEDVFVVGSNGKILHNTKN